MTGTHSTPIFQLSDLNRRSKDVMDSARQHCARIRDTDGSSFVVMRESRVADLEALASTAVNLATVERAIAKRGARRLEFSDFGEWTWLEHLDGDDLAEFVDEVRDLLIRAIRELDTAPLDAAVSDWMVTARQLSDASRRDVLLGHVAGDDFVDASRPEPGEAA